MSNTLQTDKFFYDNKIVKWFAYATLLWGLVGMLVGVLAAFLLAAFCFAFFAFKSAIISSQL